MYQEFAYSNKGGDFISNFSCLLLGGVVLQTSQVAPRYQDDIGMFVLVCIAHLQPQAVGNILLEKEKYFRLLKIVSSPIENYWSLDTKHIFDTFRKVAFGKGNCEDLLIRTIQFWLHWFCKILGVLKAFGVEMVRNSRNVNIILSISFFAFQLHLFCVSIISILRSY